MGLSKAKQLSRPLRLSVLSTWMGAWCRVLGVESHSLLSQLQHPGPGTHTKRGQYIPFQDVTYLETLASAVSLRISKGLRQTRAPTSRNSEIRLARRLREVLFQQSPTSHTGQVLVVFHMAVSKN